MKPNNISNMSEDNTRENKERGSASLTVSFEDGLLTVRHGTITDDDGEYRLLIERPIYDGEWNSLFKQLETGVLRA